VQTGGDVGGAGRQQQAGADLGELAAHGGQVGVDLPRQGQRLARQVVALGVLEHLLGLGDQQRAADQQRHAARQQDEHHQHMAQLDAA
jgi:hypothetical protein